MTELRKFAGDRRHLEEMERGNHYAESKGLKKRTGNKSLKGVDWKRGRMDEENKFTKN